MQYEKQTGIRPRSTENLYKNSSITKRKQENDSHWDSRAGEGNRRDIQTHRPAGGETDRPTDIQTDNQKDRQTDRQAGRQA